MQNEEFKRALWLRLGIEFPDHLLRCTCTGHPTIDKGSVDHLIICKQFNAAIIDRHDTLGREFKSLCQQAGLQWTDPNRSQLRNVVNDNGQTTDGYIRGLYAKPCFVDFTIAHPTGRDYLRRGSATHKHYALTFLEGQKNEKFNDRCDRAGGSFIPLAFETYGATSTRVDNFIKDVVSRAAEINHIPYSVLLNYWKKRLSVSLQIGNINILSLAYRRLFNYGGGNLDRDITTERILE